jgi:hypothetical protein
VTGLGGRPPGRIWGFFFFLRLMTRPPDFFMVDQFNWVFKFLLLGCNLSLVRLASCYEFL